MISIHLRMAAFILAAVSAFAAETYKYSYDELGRLIKAESSGGLVIQYTYDASGNLLRREIIAPAKAASATAGQGNRKKTSKAKTAPAGGGQ
jgi:YD repeat-containing protein